ncbi:hypothetical protein JZO70_13450 [Enterococcus sp. 669A]|uniref:Uncharacterized protein n=1 Tax=Candidatus Enterococcus moelleringii TaxID=2815325 RepID=A0ABS3LC17_9ENTE|nr:hypothetical protein [Enterococcus sp. 669A]MBO1307177.1 hypothetical protein [Enterococcus sp. 669A]
MKFKHIVLYTIREFNKNKEKEGYLPQDGTVINVVMPDIIAGSYVAVGFEK